MSYHFRNLSKLNFYANYLVSRFHRLTSSKIGYLCITTKDLGNLYIRHIEWQADGIPSTTSHCTLHIHVDVIDRFKIFNILRILISDYSTYFDNEFVIVLSISITTLSRNYSISQSTIKLFAY